MSTEYEVFVGYGIPIYDIEGGIEIDPYDEPEEWSAILGIEPPRGVEVEEIGDWASGEACGYLFVIHQIHGILTASRGWGASSIHKDNFGFPSNREAVRIADPKTFPDHEEKLKQLTSMLDACGYNYNPNDIGWWVAWSVQ